MEFTINFAFEKSDATGRYVRGFDRYVEMPPSMVNKLLAAEPGTVLSDLSPMATSYVNGATSGFGKHKIEFTALPGTKALRSFGTGGFKSEYEVTTVPGQRFVIYKTRKRKNGGIKIKAYLLPPEW